MLNKWDIRLEFESVNFISFFEFLLRVMGYLLISGCENGVGCVVQRFNAA